MIVNIRYKDGSHHKYICIGYVAVLGSHKDSLYLQSRIRNSFREIFEPLSEIECYNIQEGRNAR